jgi:hypothetical protein
MEVAWADPATGLIWAEHDNGNDVNWNEANSYCANLRLGGYLGWRLPSIDELQGIYDSTAKTKVKGGITLTGWRWYWSATKYGSEFAGRFGFNISGRGSGRLDLRTSRFQRALCVRRSGE